MNETIITKQEFASNLLSCAKYIAAKGTNKVEVQMKNVVVTLELRNVKTKV